MAVSQIVEKTACQIGMVAASGVGSLFVVRGQSSMSVAVHSWQFELIDYEQRTTNHERGSSGANTINNWVSESRAVRRSVKNTCDFPGWRPFDARKRVISCPFLPRIVPVLP